MTVGRDDVRALRNAYSAVLDEGDGLFPRGSLSWRILLAMVVSSAGDADEWINSRVKDGNLLRQELGGLVEVLQKRDVIGNSLQATKKWASDQVVPLASSAVLGTTWPLWVGAAGSGLTAWLTATATAGSATGGILIPLVLGVLTMGGAFASHAVRASARAIDQAATTSSRAADYLFHRADTVGSEPERLFEKHVRPQLNVLFTHHGREDAHLARPPAVLRTIRRAARASVAIALVVVVCTLLVFVVGIADAWDDATCVPNNPRLSQFCTR
ncbi:hypothetical protein ACIQWR_15440 [Streptomyces sp. NPDC098789]|uniref:hypothetical protein n=1 Tax=Streptomyces sp. NPDC098789 TaxID=3366098 RepID=UPI0037F7CB3F